MATLVVLGGAESGVGAAVLAKVKGFDVFLSDNGKIKEEYADTLRKWDIPFEEGGHTESLILNADEVVKSPGIPSTAPMVVKLTAKGTRIVSEIEFASRYDSAKKICITGSNGKTTTTTLIHYLLTNAGLNVGLGGNIGKSYAMQVATEKHDYYVLEISSFQLDNCYDFRPDIAIITNITPDHLDRYEFCMQNYVDSKMRIIQNQTPSDCFVFWADDQYAAAELAKRQADGNEVCAIPFTDEPAQGSFGCMRDGVMSINVPEGYTFRAEDGIQLNMPIAELSLPGRHNVRNCIAAATATILAGVEAEVVRECLRDFPGVEHRLERVGDVRGVHYVNDSKATNVDACQVALEAQTTPVVLIVGGTDKGNDYTTLYDLVKAKCRAIVYLGADNAKLHASFDQLAADCGIAIADTHSMEDCVRECAALAHEGDTVLLSPCCASFDLFQNMGHRGRLFKECVRGL